MSNSSLTPTILSQLLVGAFMADFQGGGGKSAPQLIQLAAGKLRTWVGKEKAQEVLGATEAMHSAIICGCIDYTVLGQLSEETTKSISELKSAEKVLTEFVLLTATGRDPSKREHVEQRWAQPLWELKSAFRRYLECSPTQVNAEELAEALKEIAIPFVTAIREQLGKRL